MAYNVGTPKGKGHQMKTLTVETAKDMNDFYQALNHSVRFCMNGSAEGFEDSMIPNWATMQEYSHVNEQHIDSVASYILHTSRGSAIKLTFANGAVTEYLFD